MAHEHVLVIEDNEKNRKLAKDILEFRGYRVSVAGNAEDGLALAAAEPPDLVLMDIQLPGMNGIEALGMLRAADATRSIPVVAFTASVMAGDRHAIMGAGFNAFLSKPIAMKEFTETVAAQIAARGAN
jgi:two-component system, cell cycle response regulator DivK